MSLLNRSLRVLAPFLVAAFLMPATAAELTLPRDGWVSWEVPAVDNAPAWCCWSWHERKATGTSCNLDGNPDGIGMRHENEKTDAVKVYARLATGKVERLQVLAAACPVETKTPIASIGTIAGDDSVRWLIAQARLRDTDATPNQPIDESALAALAMHRGDLARDTLANYARGDDRAKTRKQAVFWLAMLRGEEGADITSSVMFKDADPEVRQHAAFSMTLSKSPRVAADLIRLANTDKTGEVRAQAWFWLAHTGAPAAEQAIADALRKDADEHVREQAIFALSRLPEERATRALIATAEDRSLSNEQRKRAVFWLSQSEAAGAQAYLDQVLARVAR